MIAIRYDHQASGRLSADGFIRLIERQWSASAAEMYPKCCWNVSVYLFGGFWIELLSSSPLKLSNRRSSRWPPSSVNDEFSLNRFDERSVRKCIAQQFEFVQCNPLMLWHHTPLSLFKLFENLKSNLSTLHRLRQRTWTKRLKFKLDHLNSYIQLPFFPLIVTYYLIYLIDRSNRSNRQYPCKPVEHFNSVSRAHSAQFGFIWLRTVATLNRALHKKMHLIAFVAFVCKACCGKQTFLSLSLHSSNQLKTKPIIRSDFIWRIPKLKLWLGGKFLDCKSFKLKLSIQNAAAEF